MKGFGGMIGMVVKGGLEGAKRVQSAARFSPWRKVWAGIESLIEHPGLMTHASVPADIRKELGIDDGLIRLSVGIEHIDDLIEDLRFALDDSDS